MIRLISCLLFFCVFIVANAQTGSTKKLVTATDYFNAGEAALEKGEDHEAVLYYDECLRIRASFIEAYRSRGMAHEAMDHLQEALRDYTIYLDLVPNDPSEVLFSRAVLHFRLKHFEQAKADFIRLLKSPPSSTTTIFFRQDMYASGTDKMFTVQGADKTSCYDYLGQIETNLKHYPTALAYLDTALQKNTRDADLWLHRGVVREAMNDVAGASTDYEKALQIDPTLSLAQYNLAQVQGKAGEDAKAKEFIDKAIENNPLLPYPYAQRAQFKMNKGDLKSALADYDSAVKTNPNDPSYYLNRGLLKEKLKDVNGAAKDFTQAITLKEDFDKAWFARANLCAKLNKLDAAIDDYTITIFHNALHSGAYYNRGLAYQRMNKPKEACEDFAQAEALGIKIDAALKATCK